MGFMNAMRGALGVAGGKTNPMSRAASPLMNKMMPQQQQGGIGPSMMGGFNSGSVNQQTSVPWGRMGQQQSPWGQSTGSMRSPSMNGGMGGFAQNLGGMMGGMQKSPMPEIPMGDLQGSMNQMQGPMMNQQRGDRFRQMLGGGGGQMPGMGNRAIFM